MSAAKNINMPKLTLFCLLIAVAMTGRSLNITGTVRSECDSAAIEGARCILYSSAGMLGGVSTAPDGSFSISTSAKGALRLTVRHDAFALFRRTARRVLYNSDSGSSLLKM